MKYFTRNVNKELVAFTDSDYAGDLEDRKSITDYVFMLSGGEISWSSKKQLIFTLSTTKPSLWQLQPLLAKQYG